MTYRGAVRTVADHWDCAWDYGGMAAEAETHPVSAWARLRGDN